MFTPSTRSPTYSPAKGLKVSRNSTIDTAAESPFHSRTKSLGQRLNNLQLTVETRSPKSHNNQQAKPDHLEIKIREIDQRITQNHSYTEDKLNKFANDVARVDEILATEILGRQLLEERVVKEMILAENNLALELKKEKEQNRENEIRTLGKVEGKIHAVRANFVQEHDRINEFREEQTQIISDHVSELYQGLREEQTTREQVQETIIRTISNRINKVQETIEAERKARKQTDAFIFRKFEEITSGLESQVQTEKEKRERAESQMLRLLEEACDKFESRLHRYR